MMKTKFKINSATQQVGNEKIFVVYKMITRCNMTHGDWVSVLFETGCRFVEKRLPFKALQKSLLTDASLGFWDWWMLIFIEDDETLLTFNNVISFSIYAEEKDRLIHLKEAEDQFNYFLQSNKKLNEKI